ncbi:MAG: hypothetical protein BWY45_02921 [Euryarchaeota archaeon ADurb.Bin294]|jgi:hypothetical protein|nr:MAG: hypothetical protein BWY45_02921 [Euryarchaeota archaeon ADurb.Bin294]
MCMSCNTFFDNSLSRSDYSKLDIGKCLSKPIVESVTPLFPFEGKNLVSQYLLELLKKENLRSFLKGKSIE